MRPFPQARDVPLLGGPGPAGPYDQAAVELPSAPPAQFDEEAPDPADAEAPSAPPPATLLSQEEFQQLLRGLQAGSGELPSPAQLRQFRAATNNRLLWAAQMRQIAASADGGAQLFREAYERQLLADPQNVTVSDGPWMQAFWQPPAVGASQQAAQAFLSPVTVVHHSGRIVTVSLDLSASTSTVGQAMTLAESQFGEPFDAGKHTAFAVGAVQGLALGVGCFIKVTGLIQNEVLNGAVGQVLKVDDDQYEVAVPAGVYRVHKDNLVVHGAEVVARNRGVAVPPQALLQPLAAQRLLWLESGGGGGDKGVVSPASGGALRAIKSQFVAMDLDGDNRVSAGELRNFLWNLHLSDADFDTVQKRFANPDTKGGQSYVDVADMLFMLGRPHLLSPDVPVDALIYEAVVSILGRRTTAHIDRDLSQEDRGIGYRNACSMHCPSYTVSLILQGAVFGCLVVLLLGSLGFMDVGDLAYFGYTALGAYGVYLIHLLCCVRLTRAFFNRTEGLERVMETMDRPRRENPVYTWHVQCYHYETRTRQETQTDSQGRSRTVTKTERVRVNTHSASTSGVIPSTDVTPDFVPLTAAQQTQIDTTVDLDFSRSNYYTKYHRWCAFHRWDLHQDCSHTETLPSQATSCLAVWVPGSQPCWMNDWCYWLSNIFLLSFFYRLAAQARIGHQAYTYVKVCYNI